MVEPIARRQKIINLDGLEVTIKELTAADAIAVWGDLSDAELTGNVWPAYQQIIQRCAYNGAGPYFESVADIDRLPARIVIPLGEAILNLSDIGLETSSGNVPSDPRDDSPTG